LCREGGRGRLLLGRLCVRIRGEHVQIRVSCHAPPKALVFVLLYLHTILFLSFHIEHNTKEKGNKKKTDT
jgi:hypothetical protein